MQQHISSEILGLLCAKGCHSISYSSYWGKDRGKPRYFRNDKSEKIEFFNKDIKLLRHYQNLLAKEFGYHPRIGSGNKILICKIQIINSIINHTGLGHLKWSVPCSVMNGSTNVKLAFLRGFFDGDGTFSGNRPRIFSTNKNGLKQISLLLEELGISHTFPNPILKQGRKPFYSISIRAKDRETFLNKVNPISKRPDIMRG